MARQVAEVLATFCCGVFLWSGCLHILGAASRAFETGSDFAVRLFAPMYHRASAMQASLAIIGTIASIVAYSLGGGPGVLLSAVLIGSVVPFTLLIVEPLNDQIKSIDPSAERGGRAID